MTAEERHAADSTLSSDDPEALAEFAGDPRLLLSDRYEVLELLGKGGMGMVFKARDRQIGRAVAIKVAHGADPRRAMRFQREARAQARIKHPNVCAVYQVGSVAGRPYIVLQFVAGEPLDLAARRMSLGEKLAVMRDVAEGIHEAHRLDIVHRDIKPANVMVERDPDGRWVPVITDFGLARETAVDLGLTRTGELLGTPRYMSPEQARGDVHAVDRSSDVYGLGATLYELLTGRPPFAEESLSLLLSRIIHDDPPPLRSLVPGVPVDLEIITLKCLSKDPAQRYDSARALADDLGRWLDGEPVLGRRPSRWRRVRRAVQRNRAIFALGAISLAALVIVGALGIRQWLVSRDEQARTAARTILAQQLGLQAKDIELFLRGVYQLPLHDTRPARELVRERIRRIAATRHDLSALGDAMVHDVLGRGYLALHAWQNAADELARVTDTGVSNAAEVHAGRGRALGELYHRALEDARRSGDRTWRARRQQELEQQYLKPALAELAASRGAGGSTAYLEALIALYRNDFAAAEKAALAAASAEPWLFEAGQLASDAVYSAAMASFDRGDYDAARTGLERAAQLYTKASDAARSDASIYKAWAQALLQRAEIAVRQGQSPREPLERALDVIDRAQRASPDDAQAYTIEAWLLMRWHRTPALRRAEEDRSRLDRWAQAAEQAVRLDPGDPIAWDALGNAHVARGIYDEFHGGDGRPQWRSASEEFRGALAIRPDDPWANNDLGTAHRWLGMNLEKRGADPIPEYQSALRSYRRATQIDPDYVYAWANQVEVLASIAEYHASVRIDPRTDVEAARESSERCLAADPSYRKVVATMARAQLALASYMVDVGENPTAALTSARGDLDRAADGGSAPLELWGNRLTAARIEAASLLGEPRGHTPDDTELPGALALARKALAEILARQPGSARAYEEAARVDLIEAEWARRAGSDVRGLLSRALSDARRAIALDDAFAEAKLAAAEVYLQIATVQRSPEAAALGRTHLEQARKLKPSLARARELETSLAKLTATSAEQPRPTASEH